ncbi:uncharacterized protein PRCAT00005021001 [Priceomyces carsonii]|uniref:uncharacterized protein n=1 Tax=Priceomyces carsonii TaxID=28549 RepID=UPI002EDA964D|nr:unnamed protein product [Priceomyces carsonii]
MIQVPRTTVAAVLNNKIKGLEVREIPVPSLYSDEILVDATAASINAVDYYHIDQNWSPDGSVFGIAVSGKVLKVGEDVSRFKPGDFIASFIHGGDYTSPAKGAYSKIAVVQEVYSIKVNLLQLGSLDYIASSEVKTFEGACSLVNTLVTMGVSLFHTLGGSFDEPQDKSFLIYGGSTATGLIATQVAKIFGWRVISIASKKHKNLMKGFGADFLVDYHDADFVQQVRAIDADITIALHTVGGETTLRSVIDCVSDSLPTKIDSLIVKDFAHLESLKSNVSYTMTRAFTANGRDVVYSNGDTYPAPAGIKESTTVFLSQMEKLINKYTLKHIPILVHPGGLSSINEAHKIIRSGGISGAKLVIRID